MANYKATEAKYKGGAEEMYVTYDLMQDTRGDHQALYPKVKRVYIAGKVQGWHVGKFRKRSGRDVYGVKIDYQQTRAGYTRNGYTARRGQTEYIVPPTRVEPSTSNFSKIVEVPAHAQNIKFQSDQLPSRYQDALQDVR